MPILKFRHPCAPSGDSRGRRAGPSQAETMKHHQSALSHQVKGLKIRLAFELFVRRSKTAKAVACRGCGASSCAAGLPQLEAAQAKFRGAGRAAQAGCYRH